MRDKKLLHECFGRANELLRHFWGSLPITSPSLAAKVARVAKAIRSLRDEMVTEIEKRREEEKQKEETEKEKRKRMLVVDKEEEEKEEEESEKEKEKENEVAKVVPPAVIMMGQMMMPIVDALNKALEVDSCNSAGGHKYL